MSNRDSFARAPSDGRLMPQAHGRPFFFWSAYMPPIIVIPARLNSTRLPGKIMALIGGKPMLFHVAERALAANVGPVIIACDHPSVFEKATTDGLHCVLTSERHATGTDRINEALDRLDPTEEYQTVINVQADVPFIEPAMIQELASLMHGPPCDVGTLCALEPDRTRIADPNVVKVIGTPNLNLRSIRALYFTRGVPWGDFPYYHHIGAYAYRRPALARLGRLPRGMLEKREGLEQLRALEYGMRIDAALVQSIPLSVDTPADLDRARESLEPGTHESQNIPGYHQGGP